MCEMGSTTPTRFAEADGVRVAYEIRGAGDPVMVFVHGWAGDRRHWHHQLSAFSGQKLVLLDLPGHGESDKPRIQYSLDLFARAVGAVLDSAGVERAILVGHSNGVPVIRQFYRHCADRVLALVGIDGALRTTSRLRPRSGCVGSPNRLTTPGSTHRSSSERRRAA